MSTDVPETKAASSGASPEAPGFHFRRLWSWRPVSDRQAGDAVVSNFLLHWFPAKANRVSLSWSYSFWLGTVSAALLLLLVVSGLPLLFLYIPSVERAYASVKDIEYVVTFGSWIRAVHRISAHLMVVAVALHLVRVFLTGAYKNALGGGQKRPWNWVLGVAMLPRNPWVAITVSLVFWIYYERIMFAEEEYLRRTFGAEFEQWASRTPAFIPDFAHWIPAALPFCWRTAVRRENSGMFAFVAAITFVGLAQDVVIARRFLPDPFWSATFATGALTYLTLLLVGRRTSLLRVPGR